MRRLLIGGLAALMLTPSAAALAKDKPHPHGGPPGLAKKPHGMPPGQAKKMWRKGEHLPRSYLSGSGYSVSRSDLRLLPPAPYGHRWVRVGDDAYLVQTRDGLIANVMLDLLVR